jgi:uncharacterized protein YijF (DUF1287 family)
VKGGKERGELNAITLRNFVHPAGRTTGSTAAIDPQLKHPDSQIRHRRDETLLFIFNRLDTACATLDITHPQYSPRCILHKDAVTN